MSRSSDVKVKSLSPPELMFGSIDGAVCSYPGASFFAESSNNSRVSLMSVSRSSGSVILTSAVAHQD
jgi:hypothetical protein